MLSTGFPGLLRGTPARLSCLVLCLSLLLAGCGSSSSSTPPGSTSGSGSGSASPTLQAVKVSAASGSVAVGATDQLAATATYSDGSTKDVTSTAAWSDSDTKIVVVSTAGLATADAPGSVTVTASYGGMSGSTQISVPQPPKTLTSISVAPPSASVLVGATQAFTAGAQYSDGSSADVTASVTWTSSAAAVATVSAAGVATAVTPGTSTLTASLSGKSASAVLTVTAPPKTLQAIAISAPSGSLVAGATEQLSASATYSDGSTANVTTMATWTSSNSAVLTVNAAGLATAVAVGPATVTATLAGVTGSTALTVTPALTTVTVAPATAALANGATQQFTATATYSDGSTKNVTATATWSSSSQSALTITPAGLATAASAGSATVTATFSKISGTAAVTVTGITSISITPGAPSFAMSATQQFTATANYSDGTTKDVTALGTWSIANAFVATVASGGLATGAGAGSSTISVSYENVTGSEAIVVTLPPGKAVNIPTWHGDAQRTGLNPNEIVLNPDNVAAPTFGKLFSYTVDGYAYAEPLLISGLTVNGAVHNVLYVATENDTVYAFDADSPGTGAPLWSSSLLQAGETPLKDGPIQPNQGISGTPVADPTTNTLYVVSAQTSSAHGSGYRLNALDLTTGAQKFGGPVAITASVPGSNQTAQNGLVGLPGGCIQRTALLLANGNVYMGIGSCHEGWVLAYSASTLGQMGVFNVSPNLDGEGTYASAGGVWMGAGGPVADSSGYIYVSTGNGPYDPTNGAYSDSVLKLNPTLVLQDWFTPQDYLYMFCDDSDLGGGGLLLIPGSNQLVGGGKMGRLYLLNSLDLGHENAGDTSALQAIYAEQGLASSYSNSCTDSAGTHTANVNSYEIFGTAAYFNGSIYIGVTPTSTSPFGVIHRFGYTPGSPTPLVPMEFSSPTIQQNTRGTTPFISASGTSGGILWMIDEGIPIGASSYDGNSGTGSGGPTTATLRAYDPANLAHEIYDSSQNASDAPGYGIKFSSPVVANGKVYISTGHAKIGSSGPLGEIDVYGLK